MTLGNSLEADISRESQYYETKARQYGDLLARFPLSPEGEEYLAVLTEIANSLGVDNLSFASFSSAISRLSAEELSARRSLLRMAHVEEELKVHLATTMHEEMLIKKWKETLRSQYSEANIPSLERRKATLSAKAKEYQEELKGIMAQMPEEPPLTVTQLGAFHRELRSKEKVLAEMRAKVAAFQGLPPNIDLARHELSVARNEQMKLIKLRERLLDRMASGVN